MSIPTLEDVQAALWAFQDALGTEQAARANREVKAEAFLDVLARFRGGATSADLADVTRQIEAHHMRLQDMIRPPALPLAEKEGVKMSIPQQTIDALKKVSDDTDALAAVVKGLRDQIKVGMTQADVDAVNATLAEIATRLEGTAADPNNPVPPTPLPQVP